MRRLVYLVIFNLFLIPTITANERYDLNSFLDKAIKNHETSKRVEQQVESAQAQLSRVQATALPQLKTHAGLDYTKERRSGENLNKSARLSATQPLLDLVKVNSAITAGEETIASTRFQGEATLLNFKVNLSSLFHETLRAQIDHQNLERLVDTARKRTRELQQRVQVGRTRPSDLYAAQAQLAINEAQLITSATTKRQTKLELAKLSGLAPNFDLIDQLTLPHELPPLTEFTASLTEQPSVKAAASKYRAATAELSAARAQYLPQLDAVGNYYLYREEALRPERWDVALQLTIPLYDGGTRSASILDAATKRQLADLEQSQLQREISLHIQAIYESVAASLRQVKSLRQAADLAKKSYQAIENDFGSGLATNLEVLQSFNNVIESTKELDRHLMTTKSKYAELLLSTGKKI